MHRSPFQIHSILVEERGMGRFSLSLLVKIWCHNHPPTCTTPIWDITRKMWIETRHLLHFFFYFFLWCLHMYAFYCVLVLSLTLNTTAPAWRIISHCTFLIHILVEVETWQIPRSKALRLQVRRGRRGSTQIGTRSLDTWIPGKKRDCGGSCNSVYNV